MILLFFMGLALALIAWLAACRLFEQPVLQRTNYRGIEVPTAGGIVIVLSCLITVGLVTLADAVSIDVSSAAFVCARSTLLPVVGFALLGLFDDIAGVGTTSGYRGHMTALFRGELTSGAVKMLGGAVLAVIVVAPTAGESAGRLLIDGALVALAANLANLLDRAPGRVTKVTLLAFGLLLLTTADVLVLGGAAMVVGGALALLVPDLRERIMLGDTGANAIGGALGYAAVLAYSEGVRTALLVGLVALNLASEVVSFSAVIERFGPLRVLDRLGRVRTPPADG